MCKTIPVSYNFILSFLAEIQLLQIIPPIVTQINCANVPQYMVAILFRNVISELVYYDKRFILVSFYVKSHL